MTFPQLSGSSAMQGGSNSNSQWAQATLSQAVQRKPKTRAFFATEGMKPGYRVPVIDAKIAKLRDRCKAVQLGDYFFQHVYPDIAIEELGDYNPMYGGRPKKLAMALLSRVTMGPAYHNYVLCHSGLMYTIPGLPGVRSARCRITVAAWELMEHWAEKSPKFKLHWLAYIDNKAKQQIYSDCFDLALAHRPPAFIALDAVQAAYQTRLESRLYRKMIKDKKRDEDKIAFQKNQLMMQEAYAQQYQAQLKNGALNDPGHAHRIYGNQQAIGLYDPNMGQAISSGGFVAKTTAIIKGII